MEDTKPPLLSNDYPLFGAGKGLSQLLHPVTVLCMGSLWFSQCSKSYLSLTQCWGLYFFFLFGIIFSFNSKNLFLPLSMLKFKGMHFKIFCSQVTLSTTCHLISFIVKASLWLQSTWFIFTFMSWLALGHTSHSEKGGPGTCRPYSSLNSHN